MSYFLINVEIRGPLSSESLNNIIGNGILSYPKPVSKVILALNSSSSISNCFLITVLFMISFASKSVVVCWKILLDILSSLREKNPENFLGRLDNIINIRLNCSSCILIIIENFSH